MSLSIYEAIVVTLILVVELYDVLLTHQAKTRRKIYNKFNRVRRRIGV